MQISWPAQRRSLPRSSSCIAAAVLLAASGDVLAQPVNTPWGSSGESSAVAAASLAGRYASASTALDVVTIREIDQSIRRTITRSEMKALLPWMDLNTSADGPGALAFTDSGRILYIAVHDAASASDGNPSDAVLRYDVLDDALSVFARLELAGQDIATHGSLVHFKGRLYTGVSGGLRVYRAQVNDVSGPLLFTSNLTPGVMTTGLAVDRTAGTLYASSGSTISRAPVTSANALSWSTVGTLADVRSLTLSPHYGGPANAGLYALTSSGSASSLRFIPFDQAQGTAAFAPITYLSLSADWRDVAATADGAMLLASSTNTQRVSDQGDARLSYQAWVPNEFGQVVQFAKSLITTGPGSGGGPPGWVIDGDVQIGWSRFHPATPDAAAWAILLLIANHEVNNDPAALSLTRLILTRYAGLASDGIGPSRTADGIFRHWIDPATGGVKSGWDPEFATMSTMKIVLAAARARAHWPADGAIKDAAEAIICGVSNIEDYFAGPSRQMALKGLAGGGPTAFSSGFHEGILFAEQAGVYGGAAGLDAWNYWKTRTSFPSAVFIGDRPTATNSAGSFLPAFITMYAAQLVGGFRADAAWSQHFQNLRASHAAWTDDNAPRFSTVFSAGTTKSAWGGYHADSLTDHPGDVTTFPSLMATASGMAVGRAQGPQSPEAVGAYQAYRMGARQAFLGGASILYRRSAVDPAYQPDSAGLPDVAIGGLGLAELLQPGITDAVLTGFYPGCTPCPADFDGSGFVDIEDYSAFVLSFEAGTQDADFDQSGFVDIEDFSAFVMAFENGC
ncbi:MAG TPA: GC-type dockerin domain-anchored protein [Phycisphaerales bacterium]|nr:GC-type dockerin domain-anchored protein [Phycisphaerales bacterium]